MLVWLYLLGYDDQGPPHVAVPRWDCHQRCPWLQGMPSTQQYRRALLRAPSVSSSPSRSHTPLLRCPPPRALRWAHVSHPSELTHPQVHLRHMIGGPAVLDGGGEVQDEVIFQVSVIFPSLGSRPVGCY